jgi:hypothetical protein
MAPPPLVATPDEVEPEAAPASEEEDAPQPPESRGGAGPVVGRFLLGSLSGLLGTFMGGIAGAVMGGGAENCQIVQDGGGTTGDCVLGGVGALLGISTGSALGVYSTGNLLHGRGRFLHTFLGGAAGVISGLLLAVALPTAPDDSPRNALLVLGMPTLGSLVGYELSHQFSGPSLQLQTAPAPSVVPALGLTPRGGFVGGLSGRF